MDRKRFEHLLDAYGADFRRWPEAERASAAAFAVARADELAAPIAEARALDAAFAAGAAAAAFDPALSARILAAAPKARPAPRRQGFAPLAGWALAACAMMGVLLGYGAGAMAQPSDDGSYFAAAFEAPADAPPGDEG